MNIVKLKDIRIQSDSLFAFYYNEYLKGKYAYWVQMRYIFPLDSLTFRTYINYEQFDEEDFNPEDPAYKFKYDIVELLEEVNKYILEYNEKTGEKISLIDIASFNKKHISTEDWEKIKMYLNSDNKAKTKFLRSFFIDMYCDEACMLQFAANYIDSETTDDANAIFTFKSSNDYCADADIDINDIKGFRTWLATELLKFDLTFEGNPGRLFDEDTIHMLNYYKGGMYNDVVKYLSIFGSSVSFTEPVSKGCGCCGSSNLSNLYNTSLDVCDALAIYRKNIYETMVKKFSDINFWNILDSTKNNYAIPREFILTFKKYIDNIIKCNFVINNNDEKISISAYKDCTCCSNQNNSDYNMEILKRLSQALDYIGNNKVGSHEHYIHDALYDWSSLLYEYMEWK